jgi:glutaredoxin-like YruB-family protein
MPAVKIYTTPSCPWCQREKEWLKEHKIAYKELNVASDMKARNELIEKSGQMGVPITIIGEKEIIVGFDEPALKKALKIK